MKSIYLSVEDAALVGRDHILDVDEGILSSSLLQQLQSLRSDAWLLLLERIHAGSPPRGGLSEGIAATPVLVGMPAGGS